jgi:hypothetical protein
MSGMTCSTGACDDAGPDGRARRDPAAAADQVPRDELVAVALQDLARERSAADDEDLLVVLLQLLTSEMKSLSPPTITQPLMWWGERHLEGVEREVDVRAVLVAARREVPLHQLGRVLGGTGCSRRRASSRRRRSC